MRPEHKVDREGWPAGPWDKEPDRWEGQHAGFPVLAVRNTSIGNWCGYVGLPVGHRWLIDADALDESRVHGGITYGPSPCQPEGPICHAPAAGEPDDVRWIGFDCIHSGDYAPGLGRHEPLGPRDGEVYRTLEYVQAQTRELADQAARAA